MTTRRFNSSQPHDRSQLTFCASTERMSLLIHRNICMYILSIERYQIVCILHFYCYKYLWTTKGECLYIFSQQTTTATPMYAVCSVYKSRAFYNIRQKWQIDRIFRICAGRLFVLCKRRLFFGVLFFFEMRL